MDCFRSLMFPHQQPKAGSSHYIQSANKVCISNQLYDSTESEIKIVEGK